MAIELAIKVNGTQKAAQAIPARKLKVLAADLGVSDGTAQEQADAVLAWIIARAKDALSDDNPRLGDRQYDVMLAAVREADDTWDQERVMYEGMDALIAAYDALP
jgi:hypothetical protein